MSVKINGYGPIKPGNEVKKTQQPSAPKKTEKSQPKDRVDFSAVLQDVSRVKETAPAPDARRAEKVQALKEQVASGTYEPDLRKVAASLLKFLVEEK